MLYGMKLVELQKENNEIEDKDPNYQTNKKWLKNRRVQDAIYEKIRQGNEKDL